MSSKLTKALAIYHALKAESVDSIFTGSVVKVAATTGIGNSFISQIVPLLKDAGCISWEQRGNRNSQSVVRLLREPTSEDIAYAVKAKRQNAESQRLNDLIITVSELGTKVANLEAAVYGEDMVREGI